MRSNVYMEKERKEKIEGKAKKERRVEVIEEKG